MGIGDWVRQLVPFRRRNLADAGERALAIQDAIAICKKKRASAGAGAALEETDAVFDELLDALKEADQSAIEVAEAADKEFPDNTRWLEMLAADLLTSGDTDTRALEILRRQTQREPDNLPLLLRLMDCYKAAGDEYLETVTAARIRTQALAYLNPKPGDGLPRGITRELCRALVDQLGERLSAAWLGMGRKDDEALDLYEWALERDVSRTEFLPPVCARILAESRTDPKSVQWLEAHIAFEPNDVAQQRYLAKIYLETNRESDGLSILRALVGKTPPDTAALDSLLGHLRERPEVWTASDLPLLLARTKENQGDVTLLSNVADSYATKDDLGAEACELYRRAAAAGIDRGRYQRLLARAAQAEGNWSEVAQLLEEVSRREGALTTDLLYPLAGAYAKLARTDDAALEIYQAAVDAGSRDELIHEIYTKVLYTKERKDATALQQYRRALEVLPQSLWAALGLLRHQLDAGAAGTVFEESLILLKEHRDNADIRLMLAKALSRDPNPRSIARMRELGDTLARELLWKAHNEKPSSRTLALSIVRSELKAGSREPRLVPILRTALGSEPDDTELQLALSEILWRAGREEEAAEADREILEWYTPPAPEHGRQTAKARDDRSTAEGRSSPGAGSGSAAGRDPRVIAARQAAQRLAGYYARKMITKPEALRGFWLAIDMGVCPDESLVYLARHYAATRKVDPRVESLLTRALELQPADIVLQVDLQRRRAARGEVGDALKWCVDQLKLHPTRRALRELLREILDHCTKDDLRPPILGALRTMCAGSKSDDEMLEIAARAHEIADAITPQSRAIFERVLANKPKDPVLLLKLAQSLDEGGEAARAMSLYQQVLELAPNNAVAIDRLARLYAAAHRRGVAAAKILDRAMAAAPSEPIFQLYKAELHIDKGEVERAMPFLRRALEKQPDLIRDAMRLGEELHHRKEYREEGLLLMARLGAQSGPLDAALHSVLRLQAEGNRDPEEVLALYDILISRFQKNTRALYARALYAKAQNQLEIAQRDLEELSQLEGAPPTVEDELFDLLETRVTSEKHPPVDLVVRLARIARDKGEHPEDAARLYRRVLEMQPANEEARIELARGAMDAAKFTDALELLRSSTWSLAIAEALSELARQAEQAGALDVAVNALQLEAARQPLADQDRQRLERMSRKVRQETTARLAGALAAQLSERARLRYEILQPAGPPSDTPSLFRAYDKHSDGVVLLRVFPEGFAQKSEELEAFRKRAEVLRDLKNPALLTLLDYSTDGARAYATYEFLAGGDLSTRVQRTHGPLPVPEVRGILSLLAKAFQVAHAAGIIHGGLAPGHVLTTVDGRLKLTGFMSSAWVQQVRGEVPKEAIPAQGMPGAIGMGLLGGVERDRRTPNPTRQSGVTGSAPGDVPITLPTAPPTATSTATRPLESLARLDSFWSPEQLRGQPATALSDIFAFGALAFWLLTGIYPGTDPRVLRLAEEASSGPPPAALRRGGPALAALVLRCLRERPEDRFSSFDAIAEGVLSTASGTSAPTASPQ